MFRKMILTAVVSGLALAGNTASAQILNRVPSSLPTVPQPSAGWKQLDPFNKNGTIGGVFNPPSPPRPPVLTGRPITGSYNPPPPTNNQARIIVNKDSQAGQTERARIYGNTSTTNTLLNNATAIQLAKIDAANQQKINQQNLQFQQQQAPVNLATNIIGAIGAVAQARAQQPQYAPQPQPQYAPQPQPQYAPQPTFGPNGFQSRR